MATFVEDFSTHLKAGTPAIYVNTDETKRLVNEVRQAAWKSGDGSLVKLDTEFRKKVVDVFRRHTKDYESRLTPEGVKYDFEWLYRITVTIDSKLTTCDKDSLIAQLEEDYQVVEKVLNTVYTVIEWNMVKGFSNGQNIVDPGQALQATVASKESKFPANTVFVMRGMPPYLNGTEPRWREILRSLVEDNLLSIHGESSHHIVLVQPDWTPHRDIQGCLSTIEFVLPGEEQLDREIVYVQQSINDPSKATCPAELRTDICHAMRGFTQFEATSALAYCVAKHGGFVPDMVKTVINLQKGHFSKSGVLTLIDYDELPPLEDVGGFENYFEFVDEAIVCYGCEATKLGLKRPKGVLLLGIPGTGKSIVAKATARKMHLPLIVYDFAAQFGSLVGQTEATQRQALRQIDAKGPCVLMLDEADKVFAGASGGFQGDSGVNMRAFGRLLSWMANENDEAFVIMTMNRTIGVPPEMLRAGRLDAIFYTTFPTHRERMDILAIHLRQNGADPSAIPEGHYTELATMTERYVGAELEQLVKKAVRTAFKNRRQLTPTLDELKAAKKLVTPVINLDKENLKAIEDFCKEAEVTPVSKDDVKPREIRASRNIRLGPSAN